MGFVGKEVAKVGFGRIFRVVGNVGLLLLAIYGLTVSTLGYLATYDLKYLVIDIVCIGGLIRVAYDIAKDFQAPIPRTLGMITTNVVLRGALLALGIITILGILANWGIPYPHNYGLLAVTGLITISILYDMAKDVSEYYMAIKTKPSTITYVRSKYWEHRE